MRHRLPPPLPSPPLVRCTSKGLIMSTQMCSYARRGWDKASHLKKKSTVPLATAETSTPLTSAPPTAADVSTPLAILPSIPALSCTSPTAVSTSSFVAPLFSSCPLSLHQVVDARSFYVPKTTKKKERKMEVITKGTVILSSYILYIDFASLLSIYRRTTAAEKNTAAEKRQQEQKNFCSRNSKRF
ncbi:hypothetical protein M9H77_16346 [Catharanthus roseus]|uniref:Uncharacterized protein n=1 Tax=Catharanthus roseus TaxID=4058 RepID=A0ACC0B1I3_CATRO|nr:hypothetical protein M9H77_16346 [Catharanthus roseus]